jgi:hypothetical protein
VRSAAAHEVAAVRPSGVVVPQPALELGVEVGEADEVLAVEGRAGELLEGGAAAWDSILVTFIIGRFDDLVRATGWRGPRVTSMFDSWIWQATAMSPSSGIFSSLSGIPRGRGDLRRMAECAW